MAALQQSVRDNLLYAYGYLKGRSFFLPRNVYELYVSLASKTARLISLPLPFLSFLALPLYGGTSTTINLLFFYLTWSALVLGYDQLTVELYGTLAIRLLCFLLPAIGFLAFDWAAPRMSKSIKARGARQLPQQLGRDKLVEVAGVAIFNVLLAVVVQGGLEVIVTRVLRLRSILIVSTAVPLPLSLIKDVAKGFVFRGVIHYVVHRYALHTYDSPLKTWHLRWQHSVPLPFSLVLAYDHPVNYLLAQWLPTFVPACLFRFHVLTWHLFIALVSLEELFVCSGYAVLPSRIILAGMARRTDEHFVTAIDGDGVGNFGRWGVLDFVCGTSCRDEDDVLDDVQTEARKHRVQQRAEKAVDGALAGLQDQKAPKRKQQGRKNANKG